MPFTSRTFVRATIALLIVGFAAAFAILATAVWLAGRNDTTADALIGVLEIRREAFSVLNLIQDAEAGQRGYLLTQEEPYLDPYRGAVGELTTHVNRLRELAQDRPEYGGNVEGLADRIGEKLAELEETVQLASSGRFSDAMAIVRTDRGKVAMDAVRSAADSLIATTDSLVASHTDGLHSSARQLIWVLIPGALVILCVVGGTAWVAWRYTADLEEARAELGALNTTLEARVRERTADVTRANEEIQRFAYIVSHDLRSPLVNIMGFTSELETGLGQTRALLERVASDDEDPAVADARSAVETEMPEALGFIRSSTSKMDRLINAILNLSREGQRKLVPARVDMREVFEGAADTVGHRLQEGGSELTIEGDFPTLVTDRLSVEQIFGNLIDNAVKYLDPDRPGRIQVRARGTPIGVEFEVEDNGRGIDARDQERVFDLFRRAGPQDRPGEGIGLSHVRALVRRLGGTIFLRSELGVGTTFLVRLPRVLPPVNEGNG